MKPTLLITSRPRSSLNRGPVYTGVTVIAAPKGSVHSGVTVVAAPSGISERMVIFEIQHLVLKVEGEQYRTLYLLVTALGFSVLMLSNISDSRKAGTMRFSMEDNIERLWGTTNG